MVGLPNRAGRCTICKRMKCDLSRPACSRCRRQGYRCEYLTLQHGQVFINRSVANPFVKAVDIFSSADKTKLLPEDSEPKPATPLARRSGSPRISIPKGPDPGPVHRMQLLSKFIEIYFPKPAEGSQGPQGPTRASQTPASWVHILPDITLTNPAYNTSVAALCLEQLGIWNHDPVLEKEGSRLYGSALGALRKTIGSISSRKLVAPEATLASIVVLSTYEQFSGQSAHNSRWMHVQGGSYILQLLGPSFCETPVGSLLFTKIRTISMFLAFRTRRASILAGLERCANEAESHELYCHLLDLIMQLPSVMEALDMLVPNKSNNTTAERSALIGLLQICSGLHEQLLAWNQKLETQGHSPLYWMVPSVASSPADDLVLGRVFPHVFQFPNLGIAQLLLVYWSTLILLYRTIQNIQNRLTRMATSGTETQYSLQSRDRSELGSDHSCSFSNDRIVLLANNICQSLEYCYRSTNGTHGVQLAMFPVQVAQSFYESQSDRGRELAWFSQLGNTTAPDSRFDLHLA